ncbi:hypothetical protein KGY77_02905 [Candidatus Bipolaricaulota bacterium]|nr:hypothetical protein [Candidatus Bipolaricaulota bacterium]
MTRKKDRLVRNMAAIFTVALALIIATTTAPALGDTEEPRFPFKGAKMVYNVEGTSTLGYLLGTLTYTVEEVAESSYTVKISSEGNIDKLPNLVNQEVRELDNSSPLFFSEVIKDSNHVDERVLEISERQIKVNKYHLETEKEFGREKITTLVAEEVKIPLIVKYSYGDRFQLTIELDKTNVKYLQ